MISTREDGTALSPRRMIWPLVCAVLLLALAPLAQAPLPADRMDHLASFLDEQAVAEVPHADVRIGSPEMGR